ncbi:MAG: hypothetical protein JWO36_4541 [Myxococcales bacterium]|nr:hypothetical protein [Myxococcales bacterium]
MDAVEVVARIADSVVDVAILPAGARYRIGSAPGVDLPVLALGNFPLVDGDCMRVPAGLTAIVDGRPDSGPVISIEGSIELQVGLVTFTIRRVARPSQPLPRARLDRRPFAYLVASLVVQLALWFAAVTVCPFERLSPRPSQPAAHPVRVTRVRAPERSPVPKPPPQPTPIAPQPAALTANHKAREKRAYRENVPIAPDPDKAFAELQDQLDRIHIAEQVADAGPRYDPDAAEGAGFGGGGHHFDVDRVAPLKTIAVTSWGLPTFVHARGVLAPHPTMTMCDEDSCLTRGPIEIATVLATLEQHHAEIAQCYREHTGDLVGQIRVRFAIGRDGNLAGTLGTHDGPIGYGTGTVGMCVAKLAAGLRWPKAENETWVFVGIAFQPA